MNVKTQTITLPPTREVEWRRILPKLISELKPGNTELNCNDWELGITELQQIINSIRKAGLNLTRVSSSVPLTIVSAAAIGHQTHLVSKEPYKSNYKHTFNERSNTKKNSPKKLLFHEGTLRSGDHLTTEGDLLVYGDVNPGARISAGGDVMIWGKLRGIAHAGKNGNETSKISALQLRPLQLRIAEVIARGPEEKPLQGLAEQARLVEGKIIIEPAKTRFINE
ncbi:septum site-determining protein MinC [Prochlorococcus sp. MIT 1341]|uniref:septum site-determining protein MinC n=1 Tax=Prochlorococcus sp. MIT 1341 TaxID=3096221 RepID=UPI0039BF105C